VPDHSGHRRSPKRKPALLVFEDLHWIDAETQALLDGLVESLPAARMLLLVNCRPEYAHPGARGPTAVSSALSLAAPSKPMRPRPSKAPGVPAPSGGAPRPAEVQAREASIASAQDFAP
jgi:hypothetical protein